MPAATAAARRALRATMMVPTTNPGPSKHRKASSVSKGNDRQRREHGDGQHADTAAQSYDSSSARHARNRAMTAGPGRVVLGAVRKLMLGLGSAPVGLALN